MNLVVNARDAMPGGGTSDDRDRDTRRRRARGVRPRRGAGPLRRLLRPRHGHRHGRGTRSHLFEPFFTTKAPGKGTGLGLPPSTASCSRAAGSSSSTARVGVGSTFQVCLPHADEDRPRRRRGERLRHGGGTETVLVVEDEEAVRGLIAAILDRIGYTVVEARDGREALELWKQQPRAVRPRDYRRRDAATRRPGARGSDPRGRLRARRSSTSPAMPTTRPPGG